MLIKNLKFIFACNFVKYRALFQLTNIAHFLGRKEKIQSFLRISTTVYQKLKIGKMIFHLFKSIAQLLVPKKSRLFLRVCMSLTRSFVILSTFCASVSYCNYFIEILSG